MYTNDKSDLSDSLPLNSSFNPGAVFAIDVSIVSLLSLAISSLSKVKPDLCVHFVESFGIRVL